LRKTDTYAFYRLCKARPASKFGVIDPNSVAQYPTLYLHLYSHALLHR
jgi:hypothetical protein